MCKAALSLVAGQISLRSNTDRVGLHLVVGQVEFAADSTWGVASPPAHNLRTAGACALLQSYRLEHRGLEIGTVDIILEISKSLFQFLFIICKILEYFN